MKKTVALITALALVFSLSACGSKSSSNTDADKRIAELEQELADLKSGKNDKQTDKENKSIQKEIESWTDDTIIAFTDPDMLAKVRVITGVTERDITYGDVKNITSFGGDKYSDMAPLKYFTSLAQLYIHTDNDTNLDTCKYLPNLTSVQIFGCQALTDISGLGNCQNLTSVEIEECDALKVISGLNNCQNLTSVTITCCDALTGISELASCQDLRILGCDGLTDISGLANCQNLTSVSFSSCEALTDISPLTNCQNLTKLYVTRCANISANDVEAVKQALGID